MRWCLDALRLWRRAPLMLLALPLVPLLVEAPLQFIPVVGLVLSKVAVSLVGAGLFVGLDALARGQRLQASCLIAGLRPPRLGPVAVVSLATLLATATQLAAAAVVDPRLALEVALGHRPQQLGPAFRLVLLLSGLVPATLLMLAMPAVVLDAVPPARAMMLSVRQVLARPVTFGALLLAPAGCVALLAVARGPWVLGPLVLLAAGMLLLNYVAYRDLCRVP